MEDRKTAATERDLRRLDGTPEVGAEDRDQLVVLAPLAELLRLPAAERGQLAVEPARRHPALVVRRRRVCLEDDLDLGRAPAPSH